MNWRELLFDPWYRKQPEWWTATSLLVAAVVAWPTLMLFAWIASLVR